MAPLAHFFPQGQVINAGYGSLLPCDPDNALTRRYFCLDQVMVGCSRVLGAGQGFSLFPQLSGSADIRVMNFNFWAPWCLGKLHLVLIPELLMFKA